MYASTERGHGTRIVHGRSRRRGMRLLLVGAIGLALTGAVVQAGNEYSVFARIGTSDTLAPLAAAPGRFVMRCWQHGRLVFEETLSQLPNEPGSMTIRLHGADRAQSTYQLVDTRTAVCLVKPALDKSASPSAALPGR